MPDYRPGITSQDAAARSTVLWTFQDFLQTLLDSIDVDRSGRSHRLAQQALIHAHRDLPFRHNWTYYNARFHLATEAKYTTGTIEYDHTGGSSERLVTLTGGTWPENARFGNIVVANQHYEVEQRIDGTHLTLSAENNPGVDIAASTAYAWYRDCYLLPIDFARMSQLFDPANVRELDDVTPSEYLQKARVWRTPSVPYCYTLMQSRKHLGSLALFFGPAPESPVGYDAIYQRQPRELRTEKESTGVVGVSGTAVTGVGTAFSQKHVGSVLRLSDNTQQEPTPYWGGLSVPLNPYAAQRIITSVASATSATIDASATTDGNVKYTISDPIDIEAGAMMTAFQMLAEAHLSRLLKREDAMQQMQLAEAAIVRAIQADERRMEMHAAASSEGA